jgi:predicted transcriptional regulator
MEPGERDELVHTLTRRRAVLAALDDAPRRKPELVANLDVARSTVDRAIRQLETEGLVERVDDGFALSTCGELAVDVYGEFAAKLDAVCETRDVVEHLPSGEFADSTFLVDAEVVRATVSAPDRPVRAFVEMVADATHARGFSPTAYGSYVDAFEHQVLEGGMTAELAFSDDALGELTGTHGDAIERVAETGRVDVYRIPSLPAAGVVVLTRDDGSRVAAMGVHDGSALSAVVRNDAPAAVAWASSLVDDQFDRAERMPL